MHSSSGGYLHQSQLRQSQLTSTPTNLLSSSSRRLKECVLPSAMCRRRHYVHCSPWCISATSVNKFPPRKCGKWWRVRLSKLRSRQKQWRASVEDWRQLQLRTPCEKFLATPLQIDIFCSQSTFLYLYLLLLCSLVVMFLVLKWW